MRSSILLALPCAALLLLAGAAAAAPPSAALSTTHAASGRAPLLVYFDATGSADPDTSKPIHHLEYCFDAGDGNLAEYALSGHKRVPKARFCGGPQFAYVYETPGVYTARVTVTDATGAQSTAIAQIRVTSWSAAETRCVSDNGDFSGCPVCSSANGTSCVQDRDFDAAIAQAFAAGRKRVLLRPGGDYAFDSSTRIGDGPILIGSFDGSRHFRIRGDISGDSSVIFDVSGDDVRIQNLDFAATSPDRLVRGRADAAADSDHILVRDMTLSNMGSIMTSDFGLQGGSARPQNWGFFEIDASGGCGGFGSSRDNCFFTHVERLAVVGSDLRESGEHIIRLIHFARAFIHANRISDAAGTNRNLLSLRGDDFSGDQCGNGWSGLWAELAQVSDNHFECNSNGCVPFGSDNGCAPNAREDIRTRNNIFERNYFTIKPGMDSAIIKIFDAQGNVNENATFRNNAFDLRSGPSTETGFSRVGTGFESYNNAVFSDGPVNFHERWGDAPDAIVERNVVWTTGGGGSTFAVSQPAVHAENWDSDGGGGTPEAEDGGVQQLRACPFVSCPPESWEDFATTGSLASVGPQEAPLSGAPDGPSVSPAPLAAPFLR